MFEKGIMMDGMDRKKFLKGESLKLLLLAEIDVRSAMNKIDGAVTFESRGTAAHDTYVVAANHLRDAAHALGAWRDAIELGQIAFGDFGK